MKKNSTPLLSWLTISLWGLSALLLLPAPQTLQAQCSTIGQTSFSPIDTTHCGSPLTLAFQSALSLDTTPVWLSSAEAAQNFQSAFSFSFPTENNGCYYFLEIQGFFTLWSNTDDFFDAFGKFDISTGELIEPGVSNKLAITPPLFLSPNTYTNNHVYRYYYLGDGSTVTVSFTDNQLSDNSGAMTFSWHVEPCFSLNWDLGDGSTSDQPLVNHIYTDPGTYPVTLTVTDIWNGCSEMTQGVVQLLPQATSSLSATICGGDTYSLGNSLFTETGLYSETFTSYLGCDSTVYLDLQVLEPVAAILPPDPIDCNQTSVFLDGSGSSGGPGTSYLWTGPAPGCLPGNPTQPSILASCPGTYTLQVTEIGNNGVQCQALAEVTVQDYTALPFVTIAPPALLTCMAPQSTLDGTGSSTGPSFSYLWTTTDGNIVSGANSLLPIVDAAGTYLLTVTNQTTGCEASAAITLSENVDAPLVELQETIDFPCDALALELTPVVSGASQNLAFSWQTVTGLILAGATAPVVTIGSPGVYQLVVVDLENGCEALEEVTVVGTADMQVLWEAIAPGCVSPTGSIAIEVVSGGKPPFLYSIDGGSQYQPDSDFPGLGEGLYELVVQDATGCETEGVPVMLQTPPPVSVATESELTLLVGEAHALEVWVNLPADQIDSVRWTPAEGLSCADCLEPLASPAKNTEYRLEVWDQQGCYGAATVRLYVEFPPVYVPNVFSPNADGINDAFMIFSQMGSAVQIRRFRIYDRWGQPVFQQEDFLPNDPAFGWDGTLRGSLADPGVYTWMAEVLFADGTLEVFKGGVLLVR